MNNYSTPVNHGRCWDREQTMKLIYASRAFVDLHGYTYPHLSDLANYMGRTVNSILARMYHMLGDKSLNYNDNILYLFRNFDFRDYCDMKDELKPNAGPTKYLLVSVGFTSIPADTMEEAETTARALIQKQPTREIFIFQAVKRVYTPVAVSVEDIGDM